MANFKRTAKPVASWTSHDLKAFNIEIIDEHDIQTFFGVTDLPVPQNTSPVIWNNVSAPSEPLSKTEKILFAYMEDALLTPPGELSLVDDFALFLLELFDYDDGPRRFLQPPEDLWLPICGSRVLAKIDGAVIERVGRQPYFVLLVQEDTHLYDNGGCDPETQLVAQAIAAFHRNHEVRNVVGLPALDAQTFPAIIMFCTVPVFYFVTITKALADAVQPESTRKKQPLSENSSRLWGRLQTACFHCRIDGYFSDILKHLNDLIDGYFSDILKHLNDFCPQLLKTFRPRNPPCPGSPPKASSLLTPALTVTPSKSNPHNRMRRGSDDIAATTRSQLSLVNENDQEARGNVITVDESNDDSCLSSTDAASASSSAVALTGAGSTFPTTPGSIAARLTTSPGALWTARDLQGFNIKIIAEHDIQTFFGVSELPVPHNIPPVIWDNVRAPDGLLSKTEKMFFAFMENALPTPTGQGSHAVDLIRFMLRLLDYDDGPNRVLHSRKDIWFIVSGLKTFVKTDVAVIERFGRKLYYNLLVQENTGAVTLRRNLLPKLLRPFIGITDYSAKSADLNWTSKRSRAL
ncbi:hypothetical protein D9619_004826 [Psilocybe cf. subviscida]|uniref:Uncharacterized protein n=1 Tax=Psilocybe cf. subviscida TaxID=2480587 RepID=A0A8H5BSJ3_9AGAR|nr:hypothetical protein D9619_004826 [Psilocybe cf. subviscida]